MNSEKEIYQMERDGQEAMQHNQLIPLKLLNTTQENLLELGFTLGDPVGDGLFRYGSIPKGWTLERDFSGFHTYIIDKSGNERGNIFYKASPYDRSAYLAIYGDHK